MNLPQGQGMPQGQGQGQTAQIVKPRLPLTWSGQRFDIWRNEVEKWYEENRNPEANKYQDLTESLKLIKDEKVRTYVNKALLERVRDEKP